jgi:hypothetical protein
MKNLTKSILNFLAEQCDIALQISEREREREREAERRREKEEREKDR